MSFREEGALRGLQRKDGIGRQFGEPAELVFSLAQPPRDLCRRSRVPAGQLVRVRFCLSEHAEVALDSGQLVFEFAKMTFCPFDFLLCSLRSAPFVFAPQNPANALLQKTLVLTRRAQCRHTEVSYVVREQPPQYGERLGSVGSHQDAVAVGEQVADQVGDRVTFACPRWALNEDTRIGLKALDNLSLFFVRRQWEKKSIGLAAGS